MEGDFIKGKNRVVETITKPRRNLESSATTTATTEKIASHFKSHQVNTVVIQIGKHFQEAARNDFDEQIKTRSSNKKRFIYRRPPHHRT